MMGVSGQSWDNFMTNAVFEKDGRRELWVRFPGGDRGGWFRPCGRFLSSHEVIKQGWRLVIDGNT